MRAQTADYKSGINPAAHQTGKVQHHIHLEKRVSDRKEVLIHPNSRNRM